MDAFVETNGIRLHYLDFPGDGPTLLLAHGLTANAHFFDGIVAAGLSPALRVLSVDLRGRGDSDKPDSGYAIADHAADLLGLMDGLGLDQVALGGHSFGGLVSYYLAANHPERFSKCVLLDAPAEVEESLLEQIRPALARLEATFPSWPEYLKMVKKMPYFENWWDPALEDYYRSDVRDLPTGEVRSKIHPQHIEECVNEVLGVDFLELAKRVRQPTLLLRAPDPFGPPGYPALLSEEKAERTIAAIPDARLVEVPGNHVTFAFGESARVAAELIVGFVLE
jgi:pimeloyl-ACP methyl ester carboxylesterase